MALASGTRIGIYEVVALQGAGGMGEVYRARDTRLNREVALKVLPDTFTADNPRMARFQREAQILASLNHPHIATLHGLEEAGGTRALVMELVEGPMLSDRIARGPIPPAEALRIAKQIAEALEYAHEKGVIHRDLKPANIKFTSEGTVKLLDFGLAKALLDESPATDASHSPTLSLTDTRAGVLLGTLAYMSPEQARGASVDRRTDIWAFAVVLGEMLTGVRLFDGETASDTIAAVLRAEPHLDRLPKDAPDSIQRLLRRCLEKDPRRRLRDIGDARIEIEEAMTAPPPAPGRATGPRRRAIALWCTGGAIAGAIAAGAVFLPRASRPARPAMRFNVVTNFAGVEISPSLSPDGRSVALVSDRDGQFDVYVALVAGGSLVRVTNDANMESRPRWSPDGSRIAFARLNDWGRWDVWVIPALGGTPRKLISNATDPAWSPDGSTLVYGDLVSGTLWLCDASGGNARRLTAPDERLHRQPAFSPDGRQVAFTRRTAGPRGELAVVDVATGTIRDLTRDGALAHSPVWSPDRRFIYFASSRGGTTNIWRIAPGGDEPEQVTAGQGDDAEIDLSSDGRRLVFATVRQDMNLVEVMLDAAGKTRRLTSDAARGETMPAYSPDGSSIAYFSNRKGAENESIWVMRADGSNPVQLVFDEMINVYPKWTSDGQTIVYAARSPGAHFESQFRRVPVSGGQPETLGKYTFASTARSGGQRIDVGPDGRIIFPDGSIQIWDPATGRAEPLTAVNGMEPLWSPSGRAIAYRVEPMEIADPQAGVWTYDFEHPPRQLFRGWVVRAAWAGEDELIVVQGSADLMAPVWRVYTDGRAPSRTAATLRLVYSYLVLSFGATVELDAHPDRRRIVVSAVDSDADIGMIEFIQ